MTIFESIIAALVQGITEFFPISSSGHVIILSDLLGLKTPDISSQIWLHFGSLLAVIYVFWKDILKLVRSERKMLFLILAGSIPVIISALFLKDVIEPFFESSKTTGYFLLLNAAWLLMGNIKLSHSKGTKHLTLWRALIIGISQVIALLPGISRSGATIGSGVLLGMNRTEAYKFSFMLFIPVVISAMIYEMSGFNGPYVASNSLSLVIGCIVTFFVSVVALKLLFSLLAKSKLYIFSIYCVIIGFITIVL